MSESKKFGTFAGVFTPSILTILGVIMYLRLGWVVGNAGLYGSLIIIAIAHVISLTTGLSISSIATDKKVGAGGVYYVLSRSLGLPVGGAIGVTLFVGTALSIALYLVGFAESFNDYLGFDSGINGLRITGSIALFTLAAIALISTAVAIRTQFFIMGAIAISIVSILLGTSDSAPQTISFFGIDGGASMESVFAIFFPAVTGFTAGIAMSGDLRDPKKSIPTGTIAAIIVGFVVYVGLAIFISYSIDSATLVGDNNILMKMALFAPAVVAGIWGATLSSALGGILGGPRILQAMSLDRITPSFLGKGRGKDNEPWNALFVTVIIAQCGILIGELDMIARVVSMFYLAAYGFINISFFLESWASSDFNPSFKVKRWVGLVGFIATFAVMFKLDMLAMIAAFVIIGGIYAWLQRKQISLGTGDIWLSVWNTLVKRGLRKLEAQDDHIRNWKPNVLMFTGGTEHRPHILEFGISLAGRNGMLTNFDLVENPSAPVLFPKNKESVTDELLQRHGIFGKKIEVQNIFKGIENIASTFGFSGIEPNTVLMGWAKNTKDPIWFAEMTRQLINLDLNVLYLDYDERYGFRDYKRIDIWWRGISNNAELTLSICKFLHTSEKWRDAEIRIIMVNNTLQEGFERKIHQKLDEYRIPATVKVLNNAIEKKDFYELLRNNSADSSLIMVGIPPIPVGSEKAFVGTTSELFGVVGTTLLVKASDLMGADVPAYELSKIGHAEALQLKAISEETLVLPSDELLAKEITQLQSELHQVAESVSHNQLGSFRNNFGSFISFCEELLKDAAVKSAGASDSQAVRRIQIKTIIEFNRKLSQFIDEDIPYLSERLNDLTTHQLTKWEELEQRLPQTVNRILNDADLAHDEGDATLEKRIKRRKSVLKRFGMKATVKVPYQTIASFHGNTAGLENLISFQHKLGLATLNWQMLIKDKFLESIKMLDAAVTDKSSLEARVSGNMKLVSQLVDDQLNHLYNYLLQSANHVCKLTVNDVNSIAAKEIGIDLLNKTTGKEDRASELLSYSNYWRKNQSCLAHQYALDASLQELKISVVRSKERAWEVVDQSMYGPSEKYLNTLKQSLTSLKDRLSGTSELYDELFDIQTEFNPVYNDVDVNRVMNDLEQLTRKVPESVEVMHEESLNDFASAQRDEVTTFKVDLRHLVDYLIDTTLQRPLETKLQSIALGCRQITGGVTHDIRLLYFMLNDSSTIAKDQDLDQLFERATKTLDESIQALNEKKESTAHKLDDLFYTAVSGFSASQIIEQAETMNAAIRKDSASTALDTFTVGMTNAFDRGVAVISGAISDTLQQLAYSQRAASSTSGADLQRKLLTHLDLVSPSPAVINAIPYYYQQLFIGKHSFRASEFKGRSREMAEADKALGWWKQSVSGAIMVLGEPLGGKTFLSEMIAKRSGVQNIIRVDPPVAGSVRERDLIRVLANLIGASQKETDPLNLLEKPSAIIFNDIELWWERSDIRNEAIERLKSMILEHGRKHLFIINTSKFAYNSLKATSRLEDRILATISLGPVEHHVLKEIVMSRHKAGGMQLIVDGNTDEAIPERKINGLISDLSESSNGNLGVAMHQWLAGVEKCEHGALEMHLKHVADFPELDEKEKFLVLAQLVVHKHLSVARIKRIFGLKDRNDAARMLDLLIRSRVILEVMGTTYKLNPYMIGSLLKRLEQYKLIS